MTNVLLISATEDLQARLVHVTDGQLLSFQFDDRIPADLLPVLQRLGDLPLPDVLVLDGIAEPDRALQLAGAFTDLHPVINVVLVAEERPELALTALRSGVRDIISPTSDADALRRALDRASRSAQPVVVETAPATPSPSRPSGRIVTVVSPKGGVGKTTVATNLAVGLAGSFPGATVLVDLDIQFGDVGSALDLEPEYFLQDTVRGQARRDAMALKTILTEHPTGLYVICAPNSPIEADSISGDDVSLLLRTLASEFRYVVVDTAPGLSEHTLSALDETTDLIMLSSMEVPGVRGLRKELDTLSQLKMLPANRRIVINFADPHSLLNVADIEATIKTSVDAQLPRSKAASDAVNQGVPLLQSRVKDPLTKQLRKLVDDIVAGDREVGAAVTPVAVPHDARSEKTRPRRAAARWSRTRQKVAG